LIRTGVDEVRIAGRSTRGVTLFRVGDDERVVTVTHLSDDDDDEETDEVGEGTQTGDAPADNAEDSVTTEAELPQGEDAEAAPEKSDGEE
jgi:DNA gyrase subunit A